MTDEESVNVEISPSALLTAIIGDIVSRFAGAMTPPGGNPLLTEARLYAAVRDACDMKAQMAEMQAGG
jgi:hypothetical protein